MGNQPYKGVKEKVIKQRDEKIQDQLNLIREVIHKYKIVPQRITRLTLAQVINQFNNEEINSQMLVASLALTIIKNHQKLNLITMTNFKQALQMAKNCDKIRKQTRYKNWTFLDYGKQQSTFLPPLFGIPISVKDVYDIKGLPTTLGLISRVQKCQQDCPLITCFRNSGLIPFVKSNVPQYCMSAQTNNNLWGRSISPWNYSRAVGGSSGGQGGLISSRSSFLGVGSDIGGSIRVPADHCGVYGLKISSKRISNTYHAQLSKAVTAMSKIIPLCVGPLARSAQDLALFLKIATTQQYYKNTQDPYTKIIPFNSQKYLDIKNNKSGKKLKIGYIKSLIDIQPSPTSTKALNQSIQILKYLGHQLIQIKIPNQKQLIRQYMQSIFGNKAYFIRDILAKQKPTPQNQMVIKILQIKSPISYLVQFYSKLALPRVYYYSYSKKIKNIYQYQTHVGYVNQLKNQWIQYWRQNKLDFVICPGFACQAIPHGQSNKLGYVLAYTFIWNILDMVVGCVPVTIVRQQQQYYESKHNDIFTKQLQKCAQNSVGLPAGIQVIGLPYQQEQVLGLMSVLQNRIQFNRKHKAPQVIQQRIPGQFSID